MSTVQRELLSMRAYADRRGCDVSAVSRQVKRGRISLIDGKIDPEVADVQWARTTRPRADGGKPTTDAGRVAAGATSHNAPEAPGGGEDYWESRARREKTEADKADVELARLQNSLVDRSGVEMAVETAWRQVRDTIMSVPDKLPIDSAARMMFRDALRDALTDSQKMLPTMMAGEPMQ